MAGIEATCPLLACYYLYAELNTNESLSYSMHLGPMVDDQLEKIMLKKNFNAVLNCIA